MAVPTQLSDLSATAASNSPAGTDSIGTSLDDFLRAHASIIKRIAEGTDAMSTPAIGAGGGIVFEGTTADAYETTLIGGEPTADRTVTIPDATDTLVGKATTDTLTNKTIIATTNTVYATPPVFSANRTASVTLSSGVDYEVIFNNEAIDTNSFYDVSNGVFPPTVAGYYQFNCGVTVSADTSITKATITFLKNRTTNVGSIKLSNTLAADTPSPLSLSTVVAMNGTDYLSVFVNVTGTGTIYLDASATLQSTFSGFLVRAT